MRTSHDGHAVIVSGLAACRNWSLAINQRLPNEHQIGKSEKGEQLRGVLGKGRGSASYDDETGLYGMERTPNFH